MPFVLEPLRDDHLDDVVAVEEACVGPGQRGWSRQLFADELAQDGRCYLVALLEGELLGFGGVWVAPDEAHVTTLSVRQDARRQGIATALLSALLAHASAAGARAATLEVRASNTAALRLYAGHGFVPVGVRPGYYPGGEDAVIMWLHGLDARLPPDAQAAQGPCRSAERFPTASRRQVGTAPGAGSC